MVEELKQLLMFAKARFRIQDVPVFFYASNTSSIKYKLTNSHHMHAHTVYISQAYYTVPKDTSSVTGIYATERYLKKIIRL